MQSFQFCELVFIYNFLRLTNYSCAYSRSEAILKMLQSYISLYNFLYGDCLLCSVFSYRYYCRYVQIFMTTFTTLVKNNLLYVWLF